jgi:ribose transport system permease protein
MKTRRSRFLTDYGMVVVLLLLCVFFSAVTSTEQSATGEAAVGQVVGAIRAGERVLVVGGGTAGDAVFLEALEGRLRAGGVEVKEVVVGGPREARLALERVMREGKGLDGVACSELAGRWLVFEEVGKLFPGLSGVRVVKPMRSRFPSFLKADNLLNIANQIAVIAIVAIGMTMVIVTGGIDLSVGSLIALSAVLVSVFIRDYGGGAEAGTWGLVGCCVAAVGVCGCFGVFSGWMVTRFEIPPFIVTLGMMLVGSGLAFLLADGQSISAMPDAFVWLGRGADLVGLPNAVVLMFGLYGVAHVVMTHTRLGRHFYAVGGNREAAMLSGIPLNRVVLVTYVASALLAGLGGVIMASQLKSGSPTYGTMYELYVIAAVVVGGASLSGGKGRMFGTLIGALTIAVIQNGMNLTNVESYTQKVVLGLVILGAVLLDKVRK